MTDAPRLLSEPSEPVPPVVVDAAALAACVEALRQGSGLLAVDTERAGGHRYSQRAYLLQFRRAGSGTWLIDPISAAADDGGFEALAEVINPLTWVLHSAGGDLPALAETGSHHRVVRQRIGRAPARRGAGGAQRDVGDASGRHLAKSHSAADWSRRPLPPAWLHYAALDVELLLELAADVSRELIETGRDVWAAQEFEFVRTSPPPAPDPQRWRKVKSAPARPGGWRWRARCGSPATNSLANSTAPQSTPPRLGDLGAGHRCRRPATTDQRHGAQASPRHGRPACRSAPSLVGRDAGGTRTARV